ncbi:hypothetical protein [Clostridium sp. HBUAS56010]|uniref:hypothetical protein n=1 Tax=Clostridium sp. HBUAS56010 TaxID=2571127 RepID=UPI0011784408|nr:hypothetical protein [Clostridium sp. HBUAS56010]
MNDYLKQDLISRITKCLKEENERNSPDSDWTPLNVPFMLAPLMQVMENNPLKELEDHLKEWSIFDVNYCKDEADGYGNGFINISFYKTQSNKTYADFSDITYVINFNIDDRPWGYCQCLPTDEDYREDKQCCGHGCDWYAPGVSIKKVTNIISHNWKGDEHDFWEFEDSFYKVNEDLEAVKLEKERAARKKFLEENILEMQKELANL